MRRFELREGTASKFWEVDVEGSDVVVRFGRIGTNGQTKRTSFASAAEAEKAKEKLVREKTGKGYAEVGASTAATEAKPEPVSKGRAKKAKPSADSAGTRFPASPTPVTAVRCFRDEDTALFERGFPAMHVLTDEVVKPEVAMQRARDGIEEIDPRLPVHVPRDVARRFVAGYLTPRTWGNDAQAYTHPVPAHVALREAALASDRAIDEASLEEFLVRNCPCGSEWRVTVGELALAGTNNETYGWRLHEMVHVHEAVLGTEPVARRLVAHLLRALRDPEAWGVWGRDPNRHNASAHHLAFALGTLRHRLDPKTWSDLVEPFRGAADARIAVFADLLACLADDARPPLCPYYVLDLAILRRDRETIAREVQGKDMLFWRPEVTYLLGGTPYAHATFGHARRLPDWKQVRLVDELGRLAMPEVAVVIGMLATARPAKKVATEWLRAHADLARPALLEASTSLPDAADRARASEALALFGTAPVEEARTLTEDELTRELAALFGGLEARLVACRGNAKKERAVMRETFDRYCETRSAAGDVMPEAYFGHELIDWRPKDAAARERWWALVQEVQDE